VQEALYRELPLAVERFDLRYQALVHPAGNVAAEFLRVLGEHGGPQISEPRFAMPPSIVTMVRVRG